ncbi:MAG: uracil-DNA glycosylase [Muribaculaceae bacterium]|nr:uracil-DNA glycosylase [Muribaculaceae bacterium]
MDVKIENGWKRVLQDEWNAPYFVALTDWVREQYRTHTVFPPGSRIFAAFDTCPWEQTRVVILGQDPYHDFGQANGLCFSVADGVMKPPSLVNILKEVESDTGTPVPESGNLERWARQGVLLLNTSLTVEAHRAGSHRGQGWEIFTDAVIRKLSLEKDGIVFILWGSNAIQKRGLIDTSKHLVLTSPHPSPLSAYRGFFGHRHFSKAN